MRFTRIQINNFYNLKDVDLDLSSGSALIVGPNGSGKSNVIKCVQQLVEKITNDHRERCFFDRRIWSVDRITSDTYIKIEANLNRNEAELLSWFHLMQVTHEVAWHALQISRVLCNKVKHLLWESTYTERSRSQGPYYNSKWKLSDTEYNNLCGELEEMLSPVSQNLKEAVFKHFLVKSEESFIMCLDADTAFTKERIFKLCIEKLYPKLKELSKTSCNDNHVRSSSDVELSAVLVDSKEFEKKITSKMDVKIQGDVAAKQKAIVDVLYEIFYDSDIERLGFSIGVNDKEMSPYDGISSLVEPSFSSHVSLDLLYKGRHTNIDHCDREKVINNCECGKCEEFRRDLQSLTVHLAIVTGQMYDWSIPSYDKWDITWHALGYFLKESLCILPQDRGVLGKMNHWILNLEEVEKQLVTWKLSGDDCEHQHFTKVKDTFKALCGLDIEVVEEPNRNELVEKYLRQEIVSCEDLFDKQKEVYGIAEKVKNCAERVMKKTGSRCLGLVATKTLGEGSKNSLIRMPPTEWSGGERECLMVLTATQMPTAETVFLDEPGHSLHPPQQAQLRRFLENHRPDQTIVTITHAVEFMSALSLKSLYHMSLKGMGFTSFKLAVQQEEEITVQPLSNQVFFNNKDMNMLLGPDIRKMFFSAGLYFVEGETDKKVLSALRRYMLDHALQMREESHCPSELREALNILEMDSWDILSLGGYGFAVKAYKAAKALKIPCAVILDGDTITHKCGTKVQPITKQKWEKSKLYRALKTHEKSFSGASKLLEEIESEFEISTSDEMQKKMRTILEEYGFWIWNGDLETIIFDDKDAREEIKKMKEFVNLVLSDEMDSHLVIGKSSSVISLEKALDKFDEMIGDPIQSLCERLENEVSAARDAKIEAYSDHSKDPRGPVTEELQSIHKEFGKIKQWAIQYDNYFQKGNKRLMESNLPRKKQRITGSEEGQKAMPAMDEEGDHSVMAVSEDEDVRDDEAFWKRVKKQLHDRGVWMKIPEQMMQNIIGACLKDGLKSQNPLAEFLKFMKHHQLKHQVKPEAEFPKDIVARILSEVV